MLLLLVVASSASALSYALNFRNYDPSQLEVTKASGATVFRSELDFTCTNGGANWGQFDPIVEAAWKRGITILPILVRSARADGQPACENAEHKRFLNSGDGNWGAWYSWSKAAVERYGINGSFWNGKANPTPITAWEVGNEPNLPENNPGGSVVQPAAYGEFLSYTANALQAGSVVKTAHGTEVISAGLYMPGGYDYNQFLEKMGHTNAYTAVGIHPYAFYNGATAIAGLVTNVRNTLNNKVPGGSGKALWITELGWNVGGIGGMPPGTSPVDEPTQAARLHESFDWIQANAAANNIALLTWYKIQDQSPIDPLHPNEGSWADHTGLRRFDGSYRPAWYAFVDETGGPPPYWHSPDNLGGEIVGDPDIGSAGAGQLGVFARGTNNYLHLKSFQSTAWGGWSNLGGPTLTSGPGEVAQGPSRGDVVGRTTNGSVAHWWYDGSWHSDNLGGEILDSPDVSSWGSGRLDVFARGTNNYLHHKWYTPATGWSGWENLGGPTISSGPGAVSWGQNRIDVVARATNGSVAHWWYDGTWHSENLGGEILESPDISSWASGRLDVFARGTNNYLHHKWYTPATGWSGWENLGGPTITSGPGAVSWGVNRIDVVARAMNGSVEHWWYGQ